MPDQTTTTGSAQQGQSTQDQTTPIPVVTEQSLHDPLPMMSDGSLLPQPQTNPISEENSFSLGDLQTSFPTENNTQQTNSNEPIISPDTPLTPDIIHIPEPSPAQDSNTLLQSPFTDATFVTSSPESSPTIPETSTPTVEDAPIINTVPTVSETPATQPPTQENSMVITDMFYELGDVLKDVFDLMNKNIKEDTITLQWEDETKNPQMYSFQIVDGGNGIIIGKKDSQGGQDQVLKYMYNIIDYKLDVFLNDKMIYEEFDGNTHVFKLKDTLITKTQKFKTLAENQRSRLQEEKKKADEEEQNSQLEKDLSAF